MLFSLLYMVLRAVLRLAPAGNHRDRETTQLYYFRRDDSPQTALLTVRLTGRAPRPGVRRAARSADFARPGRWGRR